MLNYTWIIIIIIIMHQRFYLYILNFSDNFQITSFQQFGNCSNELMSEISVVKPMKPIFHPFSIFG